MKCPKCESTNITEAMTSGELIGMFTGLLGGLGIVVGSVAIGVTGGIAAALFMPVGSLVGILGAPMAGAKVGKIIEKQIAGQNCHCDACGHNWLS